MIRSTLCSASTLLLVLLAVPANAQTGTHYSIYLLGGQSNAAGKALTKSVKGSAGLTDRLVAPQTDVQIFNGAENTGTGVWENLQPGRSLEGAKYFGPEITLGRTLADAKPDEHIRIIKYARGDRSLHTDWNPDGGSQYAALTNTIAHAIAALGPDDTFSIEGFAWLQGENDGWSFRGRSTAARAAAYGDNLTRLIGAIRRDLGEPDLPFVIGRISDSELWDLRAEVRAGQDRVNATVAGTALFSTDDLGLRSEKIGRAHYDAPAQEQIGARFATAFLAVP